MPTPETIMTDNGKSFLSQTFGELLDEMKARDSSHFTLTRDDGGALGLLTTDPDLIERIERTLQQFDGDRTTALEQEVSHEEA